MMLKKWILAAAWKCFLRPLAIAAAILRDQMTTLKLLSLMSLRISSVMCLNYVLASLGTEAALTNSSIILVFSFHFSALITDSAHFSLYFLKISTGSERS